MAGIVDKIRVEHYGTPADDIAPEDTAPELEDCIVGLSDDSLLHWPQLSPR